MTSRNFGIPHVTSRTNSGGNRHSSGSHYARNTTPRDLPPLPSGSIPSDDFTDAERSSAAGKFVVIFLSLCFAIPMILAGIMMGSR